MYSVLYDFCRLGISSNENDTHWCGFKKSTISTSAHCVGTDKTGADPVHFGAAFYGTKVVRLGFGYHGTKLMD